VEARNERRRPAYREEPCRSALNRVKGFRWFRWSLNPYMGCAHRCAFCYVRAFERRADRPSDDRYGRSIRVKVNVADVLRRELARPSWRRDFVAIGAATDPYQPAEAVYGLTRGCIEALGESCTPFGIVTRGTLVVRDIDVLQHAAGRARVGVHFSVPTLDERVWRITEPGTPPPWQRLRALRMLADAGIRAGVALAPILPGLTDRPDFMRDVVRAARDAGAADIWGAVLYLRAGTREHFLDCLSKNWPELLPRYEKLYADRAYLAKADTDGPLAELTRLRRRFGVADRRRVPLEPPRQAEQIALAI
jgi:DNA repair photolyase